MSSELPLFLLPKCDSVKGTMDEVQGFTDPAWRDKNWVSDKKYDGARYGAWRYSGRDISILSNRVSDVTGTLVDKTDRVPHVTEALANLPHYTIFDGELVAPPGKKQHSNYITHIMGSDAAKAIRYQEEEGYLPYVVFDLPFYNGHDLRKEPREIRRAMLEEAVIKLNHPHIVLSDLNTEDSIAHYLRIRAEGGEGVILKKNGAIYEAIDIWTPKRMKSQKKAKGKRKFDTVIVGFTQPNEESIKSDGTMGANSNFLKGWISGIVLGQFIPASILETTFKKNVLVAAATKVLKGYNGWKDTLEEIVDYCKSVPPVHLEGEAYYLVPNGVTVGMDFTVRQQFSERPQDFIGKVAQIEAQERMGITYRHPAFEFIRDDKNITDCTFWANES